MKNPQLALAATALILTGCASTQETRLYILSAPQHTGDHAPSAPQPEASVIFIAPVLIPGHLTRPAVITQTDRNELSFSDFHQWAEPLEKNIRQALARNLRHQLQSNLVFADARRSPDTTDLYVEVWIYYLSGKLGKTARLEARWSIQSDTNNQLMTIKKFQADTPLPDSTYHSYVSAQSKLLSDLSGDIAAAIEKLRPSANP